MDESWGILLGSAIVLGALAGAPAALALGWLVLVAQVIRRRMWWVPFAVVIGGVLLGAGRSAMVNTAVPPPALETSEGAAGVVMTLPEPSGGHVAAMLQVEQLVHRGERVDVEPFMARVSMDASTIVSKGDHLVIEWSASDLDSLPPGYAGYLAANGVMATGRAWSVDVEARGPVFYRAVQGVRDDIGQGFRRVLPGDPGALATGIVTGDDSGLSDNAENAFLRTGTSHITAVSGSNVAMVLAVWNLLLPAGRRRKLLAVQILIVTSIWLYALLTGLEPPATRAATMASLMLFGSRFGRRADPMTLLAVSSAAMVLWNPRNAELISFWLSVVATAAIIMRVPVDDDGGWASVARGMFEGTMLAQIATLPLVLMTFGTWSLISVLANMLLAPLMWLAFPFCFLLAAILLTVPALATLVSWAPFVLLTICLQLVAGLGDVVPQISIVHAGLSGVLAIGLPSAIVLLLLGRDGRRWLSAVLGRGRDGAPAMLIAGAGPLIGVIAASVLIVLLR